MRTAIAATLLALASSIAMAGEKVQPDQLPQAVSDAVKKQFPQATIESAEREKEDGRMKYELKVTDQDAKYEFDVAEDGTVLEFEKEGM